MLTDDLAKCCAHVKTEPKKLARPVATRWNSIAEASARAIDIRPALDRLVELDCYNTRNMWLKPLKLSAVEWTVLTQLRKVLDYFLYATNYISQSSTPLLHQVIPSLDLLTTELEKKLADLHSTLLSAHWQGSHAVLHYSTSTTQRRMIRLCIVWQ